MSKNLSRENLIGKITRKIFKLNEKKPNDEWVFILSKDIYYVFNKKQKIFINLGSLITNQNLNFTLTVLNNILNNGGII